MKNFILFIVIGAICGGFAEGAIGFEGGAVVGAGLWVLIKIVGFLNRNTNRIADIIDDD